MDDPAVAVDELRDALGELESVNRLLGGYPPSVSAVASLISGVAGEVSLLDVGCGGGDTCRRLLAWARARGVRLRIRGIDRSAGTVAYARERSSGVEGVDYEIADLFDLDPAERFDVVHAALVLHHFRGDEAPRALRRMHALARRGVAINDLHRHRVAYWSIKALTGALSRNRLIRNDAPLSVRRGFARKDWHELASVAGLPSPRVRWRWPFRWQVVIPAAPGPQE